MLSCARPSWETARADCISRAKRRASPRKASSWNCCRGCSAASRASFEEAAAAAASLLSPPYILLYLVRSVSAYAISADAIALPDLLSLSLSRYTSCVHPLVWTLEFEKSSDAPKAARYAACVCVVVLLRIFWKCFYGNDDFIIAAHVSAADEDYIRAESWLCAGGIEDSRWIVNKVISYRGGRFSRNMYYISLVRALGSCSLLSSARSSFLRSR